MKSAGDENDRLGGEEGRGPGCCGSRRGFVDQVCTRWREDSEASLREALDLSPTKDARSEVGVEGGVFAEANTSNWRER